ELEHDHPLAERFELGRGTARQARLAAAREARDPDRPAHRLAPNIAGSVSGSKGAGSSIVRANRISVARVSADSATADLSRWSARISTRAWKTPARYLASASRSITPAGLATVMRRVRRCGAGAAPPRPG